MRGPKWALIFEWRRDFPDRACRLGCFFIATMLVAGT
jgi:hypothetical protein